MIANLRRGVNYSYRFAMTTSVSGDRNVVADADRALRGDLPVDAAAAVGNQGLAQALVLFVHDSARFGLTVNMNSDLAERDGLADRAGQIDPLDEEIGSAHVPGQVGAQFATDLRPRFNRQQRHLTFAVRAVLGVEAALGQDATLVDELHRVAVGRTTGDGPKDSGLFLMLIPIHRVLIYARRTALQAAE